MDPQGSGLREYLDVVWRRKWWIVVPTIVCVLVGLAVSARQEPVYDSSSEVLLLPLRDPSNQAPAPILIENEQRIAGSVAVREIAQDLLSIDGATLAPTSVQNPSETQTLVFAAHSSDPRLAQASADAHAQAYLNFRNATQLQNVETAATALQEVIAGIQSDLADARRALATANSDSQAEALSFEIGSLTTSLTQQQTRLNELQLLRNTRIGEILAPASFPEAPSSPNHARAGTLGGVIGVLVGLGLAFLRERLDPRVHGRDDLERAAEAPLLATIPRVHWRSRSGEPGLTADPRAAEAFRSLRARILFAASQQPLRSLLVTSPTQGEGKTTTAAALAIALSEAGKRVVLVDADLHKPTLGRYFRVQGGLGLPAVLAQPELLDEALVSTSVDHLSVLSSSSDAVPPPGGFGAAPVEGILERLEDLADIVIFDGTPVLSLSDAVELAPSMDGVMMVVDVGKASWGDVEESALQLRSVGAALLGVVATKVIPGRFRGYHHLRYDEYQRLMPVLAPPPASAEREPELAAGGQPDGGSSSAAKPQDLADRASGWADGPPRRG